jgi:hypothetical protein
MMALVRRPHPNETLLAALPAMRIALAVEADNDKNSVRFNLVEEDISKADTGSVCFSTGISWG